jgi:hypothetical protein
MSAMRLEACIMHVRSFFKVSLALSLLAAQHSLSRIAAQTPAPPAVNSVSILELFTSEGCSSCPPADTLLRLIDGRRTSAGQLVVGISEHVTYWNNQGWKDPYSAEVFTNRQTNYASRLSPEGPYTPQMVLNGRDQFVGSNAAALQKALLDDSRRKHLDLRILSTAVEGDHLTVRFALKGAVQPKPLDIVAVLTDDVDRSNVLRGENSGRTLEHVSVARDLTRVGTTDGDTEQSVEIPLPENYHSGGSGHHLVLFAQERHQGAIVGAATMPI